MKTIILTGRLAKKFGSEFHFDFATPAEAVRALCYQIKGFEEELKKGAYRVSKLFDKAYEELDETLLSFQIGRASGIEIKPVPVARKNGGLGKIILGVVLVGAAFFFSGGALSATAFSAFGASVSYGQIALIGGLMALSGVSSMLTPKVNDKTDDKAEPTSYLIAAPQNMIEEGHPVPIVFGEVFVGSVMASAGISVEEYR